MLVIDLLSNKLMHLLLVDSPVEIHTRTNALGMDPITEFGFLGKRVILI